LHRCFYNFCIEFRGGRTRFDLRNSSNPSGLDTIQNPKWPDIGRPNIQPDLTWLDTIRNLKWPDARWLDTRPDLIRPETRNNSIPNPTRPDTTWNPKWPDTRWPDTWPTQPDTIRNRNDQTLDDPISDTRPDQTWYDPKLKMTRY
jgi:hypothetical protein